jgi:hypothetical protein
MTGVRGYALGWGFLIRRGWAFDGYVGGVPVAWVDFGVGQTRGELRAQPVRPPPVPAPPPPQVTDRNVMDYDKRAPL